jgi:DNA-binding transcriptional MerR regulator
MKKDIFDKEKFNIKDLAKIVKKETQTIRSWEMKGIIHRPEKKTDKKVEWREYTRETLAETLETIISYQWERKVIKNENEIRYVIEYLRGNVDEETFSVMMGADND